MRRVVVLPAPRGAHASCQAGCGHSRTRLRAKSGNRLVTESFSRSIVWSGVHVHVPLAVLLGDRRSFDQNLHALLARKRRLMHDTLAPPAGTDDDADALFRASVA